MSLRDMLSLARMDGARMAWENCSAVVNAAIAAVARGAGEGTCKYVNL